MINYQYFIWIQNSIEISFTKLNLKSALSLKNVLKILSHREI